MKLTLKRIALREHYTIGRLYDGGLYLCDTIEDKVRDLDRDGRFANGERKVYAQTAIPYGTYRIRMDMLSPRFSQRAFYHKHCHGGRLPRLMGVNSFDGILIHCGNTAEDSAGCIIVGYNKQVGRVDDSQSAFLKVYARLWAAYEKGEEIWISVV